jgi:hypothetical protein
MLRIKLKLLNNKTRPILVEIVFALSGVDDIYSESSSGVRPVMTGLFLLSTSTRHRDPSLEMLNDKIITLFLFGRLFFLMLP